MRRNTALLLIFRHIATIAVGVMLLSPDQQAQENQRKRREFVQPRQALPTGREIEDATRSIQLEGRPRPQPTGTTFPAHRSFDAQCGGVLVWRNVFLTAAHCVETDHTIVVSGIDATCELDAFDATTRVRDVAACLLAQPITGHPYETVDASDDPLRTGDAVMLTGYSNATSPGVDFMGETNVLQISGGVITTLGRTWVRKGDSGSASYSWVQPSRRRLVAVNSANGLASEQSRLSAFGPSRQFLSKWVSRNTTHICGLVGFANADCRQ